MTPLEITVLDLVRECIERTGCAPTMQEVAEHIGMKSKSGVFRAITSLERQGALHRDPCRTRGLSLPNQPRLSAVPTDALLAELKRRAALGEFKDAA